MSEAAPITLNELPQWSPWPARILGLETAQREARTPESVLREYDRDKYAALLAAVDADPQLDVEQVKALELGDPVAPVAMSLGERLYVARMRDAFAHTTELLLERIDPHLAGAAALVDLGCGYGYHLTRLAAAYPDLALSGGEFAPTARRLAARLHTIPVEATDLRQGDVGPLARASTPAVVLLSMVLHQLPSAASAVEALACHRHAIARVIVFDAFAGAQPPGLLSLLRERYVELNHYSWDLLEVLDARSDIEIITLEPNLVGPNALLPGSLAVFRFHD
jgi:SAM-dependent methyltransferase